MRSIAAIPVFVQVHITGPSSQAISQCSSVSVAPHLTQEGLEPATIRFVAQHLNHCATAVPNRTYSSQDQTTTELKLVHKFINFRR